MLWSGGRRVFIIAPQNVIHIYLLWHGIMPDLFTALLFSLYTFTNSSRSLCPLYYNHFFNIDSQDGSNPVNSSFLGLMPSPLTQYLFRFMRRSNLPVQLIVDISCVLPVYIGHIRDLHHSELSRAVHVILGKGTVQEIITYHLGDVIVVRQTRYDLFLLIPRDSSTASNPESSRWDKKNSDSSSLAANIQWRLDPHRGFWISHVLS